MNRLAAASLKSPSLRSTPSVSATVTQRAALKSPAAQAIRSPVAQALNTDRFESGPARGGNAQRSGLVSNRNPLGEIGATRIPAQQRLDFLQKFGGPQRQNYPPTAAGAQEYREAQARYERQTERLEAEVKYEELKQQGPPPRENYPPTVTGAFEYEKARSDYFKQLQELGIAAGLFIT